ncbi:MAG: homoserine kinase [Gemmatimonadaceae bacterium]
MTPPAGLSASAFAPATIGNVGPGFDILGLAVAGVGDTVVAEVVRDEGVRIVESGHPDLPVDASKHTAGIAARDVLRRAGQDQLGLALRVTKRLPLSGGQGGSAASAVAGALATNALLDLPLGKDELLAAALVAEESVSGRHADNVGPALLGGLVIVRSLSPLDVVPVGSGPRDLRVVLAHPAQRMRTSEARAVVPRTIARVAALQLAANVAALVTGFLTDDYALIGRALEDQFAEPLRAPLLRGFADAKSAALAAGALGCSISGSGPTAFALARGDETARAVAQAMLAAYTAGGIEADVRTAAVDARGATAHRLAPPSR